MEQTASQFHPVILPAENAGMPCPIDLSADSQTVPEAAWIDSDYGEQFFETLRKEKSVSFFYGGYREVRNLYSRHSLFQDQDEPRNFHLGIDVWAPAGTNVYAPLDAQVHSFKFNQHAGDYGATIILQHRVSGSEFYTLYGHLSRKSIADLEVGKSIAQGMPFASLGKVSENGQWPPHLHFQVILDMQNYEGDYPGVCTVSQSQAFLENSPDPGYFFRFHA